MNNQITLTPVELTLAQLGREITLNTGETLCATPTDEGWKYLVAWQGQVGRVRYAPEGVEQALWALNASQEEYDEEHA